MVNAVRNQAALDAPTSSPAVPGEWPSVCVVLPTYNRPGLMREALGSVLRQDYPGDLEVLVVFDHTPPDLSLEQEGPGPRVRVLSNTRQQGLAGNRNTGILEAKADLVAFLDDDDTWLPEKLTRQVSALLGVPDALFATTAMQVDYDGGLHDRLAGTTRVEHRDLLRSRMAMLHSSSFLVWRKALVDQIGLVDESLPQSMAEDWELLLRATRAQPIVHVDEPLIRVTWGATSYFSGQWAVRNAAQHWLLENYPEITEDRFGASRAYGSLAFGYAALGERRTAASWARRAARASWREPRTYLAVLVMARVVKWQWLVRQLNARGRGL
jgi:glycosyltransferase involved in cell wall biosynthesis